MKGAKTPCMPSLVPVVQLAQPGKLFGRMVERSGALTPSRSKRASTGRRPAAASGRMMSNVAPSSPIITVFISTQKHRAAIHRRRHCQTECIKQRRRDIGDVRLVGAQGDSLRVDK